QRVIVQLESQPSPSIALPSSHSSPGFGTPSPQVTSSAPASTRGPETRGAPSRSVSPGAATYAGSPALIAGGDAARWKSPAPASAKSGSANLECESAPVAAAYAAKLGYSVAFQTKVPARPPGVHQRL